MSGQRRTTASIATIVVICTITTISYLPGMSAGFYYDDDANLLEVPALQWNDPDLEQLARSLDDVLLPSRPVSNLSLAINHLVSGLDPEPYRNEGEQHTDENNAQEKERWKEPGELGQVIHCA